MSAASSAAGAFPERVGKYELLLPLGTGGTATVYLARTRGVAGFEREVALKLVHAHLRADEESRLHLLEEARLAARIRHPNVVPVTEVDADACGVFLVMDYVEGEALSGLVRVLRDQNHRLPPRLTARIMNDALAGLHAAHELRDSQGQLVGLVHRDFSPQNILVGIEGVARLADFGVAKAASRTVRTKTGLVKGKVAYMSPEQARGHRVDRRCDVWAAGVVLWELITGRKLYDHEDDVATLLSVVTEEPPRLASVMQGVPHALDEAVAYALTSDVNNRCPSAETLRCMLESAWDECGGMATTAELGSFVRQTVGHKLAERRAHAARGRVTPPMHSAVLGSGSSIGGASDPAVLMGERPSAAPRPPEDGTKTAISAAVPAAERVRSQAPAPAWRRPLGFAFAGSLAVIAVGVLGLSDSKPEATPVVRSAAVVPKPDPTLAEPIGTAAGVAIAAQKANDSTPVEVIDVDDSAAVGATETRAASTEPARDTSRSDERSARRAAARARAARAAKLKAKAARQAAQAPKPVSPPRVLPLPQPSQRQRQQASGDAPTLNLAPDPYDASR